MYDTKTAKTETSPTFTKDVAGVGQFVFRETTLLDEIAIDNRAAAYLDGNRNPSVYANNIATMIAALEVAIVKAPPTFKLKETKNYDDLKAVYDAYIEKVRSFRNRAGDKEKGT